MDVLSGLEEQVGKLVDAARSEQARLLNMLMEVVECGGRIFVVSESGMCCGSGLFWCFGRGDCWVSFWCGRWSAMSENISGREDVELERGEGTWRGAECER